MCDRTSWSLFKFTTLTNVGLSSLKGLIRINNLQHVAENYVKSDYYAY